MFKKLAVIGLLALSMIGAGLAQNEKISALPAGAPAQGTDLVPIARSGSNYSLQVSDITGVLPSGTKGCDLTNTNGSTGYGTTCTVLKASAFSGTAATACGAVPDANDMSGKIQAAMCALPGGGGTIDARDFTGTQAWGADWCAVPGTSTGTPTMQCTNVTLLLGAVTVTSEVTQFMDKQAHIIGVGPFTTSINGNASGNLATYWAANGGTNCLAGNHCVPLVCMGNPTGVVQTQLYCETPSSPFGGVQLQNMTIENLWLRGDTASSHRLTGAALLTDITSSENSYGRNLSFANSDTTQLNLGPEGTLGTAPPAQSATQNTGGWSDLNFITPGGACGTNQTFGIYSPSIIHAVFKGHFTFNGSACGSGTKVAMDIGGTGISISDVHCETFDDCIRLGNSAITQVDIHNVNETTVGGNGLSCGNAAACTNLIHVSNNNLVTGSAEGLYAGIQNEPIIKDDQNSINITAGAGGTLYPRYDFGTSAISQIVNPIPTFENGVVLNTPLGVSSGGTGVNTFPANTVCGNNTGGSTTSCAQTSINISGTGTFGKNGTTQGQVTLNGATSGSASIATPAAAGSTSTILLPSTDPTNGQVLTAGTPGGGNVQTSWGTPGGGGTVTVVGAGSLTSTAIVTGGGTTTLQTPSATSTLNSSGNASFPGTVTATLGLVSGNPAGGVGSKFFLTQGGTAPAGLSAAGQYNCYADSTQVGILCNFNAGTTLPLVQGPASTTAGHFALWNATNGGLLKDLGADFIFGTHTLSVATTAIFDLSAATGTAAFKVPSITTNTASAAGVIDYDSTNSNYHAYSGADSLLGLVPTANVPTTGHVIDALVSSSKFLLHDSGLVTANVVNASSPGAGVAHFAGGTQTVTSSAIVAADITNNTITGTQLAASLALTTPNIGAATGTSLLATGIVDGEAPITITTGTTANLGTTYKSGYTFNQEATAGTGVTYTLPATATGLQYCVQNSGTTGVVNTGVLTVYPPASSFVILNGTVNTVGGGGTHGVASGGAAGDGACFVAIDATHWEVFPLKGTWTAN